MGHQGGRGARDLQLIGSSTAFLPRTHFQSAGGIGGRCAYRAGPPPAKNKSCGRAMPDCLCVETLISELLAPTVADAAGVSHVFVEEMRNQLVTVTSSNSENPDNTPETPAAETRVGKDGKRHLDTSQRAMVAAKLVTTNGPGQPKKNSLNSTNNISQQDAKRKRHPS